MESLSFDANIVTLSLAAVDSRNRINDERMTSRELIAINCDVDDGSREFY